MRHFSGWGLDLLLHRPEAQSTQINPCSILFPEYVLSENTVSKW